MVETRGQEGREELSKALSDLADVARRIARYSAKHPGILLTLAYLYVSAIGMVYTAALFWHFGIHIVDFAETTDFLLAAFKQPDALVMALFALMYWASAFVLASLAGPLLLRASSRLTNFRQTAPVCWSATVASWVGKKLPPYPPHPVTSALMIAVYVLALTAMTYTAIRDAAGHDAESIVSGKSTKLVVELIRDNGQALSSTTEDNMSLIGRTQGFAFFYDHDQRRTQVIPTANILRMYTVPPEPLATPTATTEARDTGSGSSTAVSR